MAVNLMAGRDGQSDDQNPKKDNTNANQKIDLTLDRKVKETGVIKGVETSNEAKPVSKPVGVPKIKKDPIKIEVKDLDESAGAAIPQDIADVSLKESKGNWGSKLVILIVLLLVIGAGILLYLLNAESQFLKGSVNEIPTSNTNIVDDILAEDFDNQANTSIETTEIDPQAEVLSQANEIINGSTTDENTTTTESDSEIPVVENGTETEIPVVQPSTVDSNPISTPITNENNGDLGSAPSESNLETDRDLISEYDLQSGSNLADSIISETSENNQPTTINQGNDFTPQQSDSDTTVQANVTQSPEISGETGPGLWLCVILTALFTFIRYEKKKSTQ